MRALVHRFREETTDLILKVELTLEFQRLEHFRPI
jgi:hypothetical protein